MIITCPKCATGLNLDDKLVQGKKVKVRCANCQNIFSAGPAPSPASMEAAGDDLGLSLDLPELTDLEDGLDEALAAQSAGQPPPEPPQAKSDDLGLDLDLPDLPELDESGESQAAAPPPPPPPPAMDDDLGDLGELDALGEEDSAGDDDGFGPLGDLEADIDDAISAGTGQDEGTLGDLDLDEAMTAQDGGGVSDLDLDLGDLGLGDADAGPVDEDLGDLGGLEDTGDLLGDLEDSADLGRLEESSDLLGDLEDTDELAAASASDDLGGLGDLEDTGDLLGDLEDTGELAADQQAAPADDDLGDLLGDLEDTGELAAGDTMDELDLGELDGETADAEPDTDDLGLDLDLDLGEIDTAAAEGGLPSDVTADMDITLDGFDIEDTQDMAGKKAAAEDTGELDLGADAEPETLDADDDDLGGLMDDDLGGLADDDLGALDDDDLGLGELDDTADFLGGAEALEDESSDGEVDLGDLDLGGDDDLGLEPEEAGQDEGIDVDFNLDDTMDMVPGEEKAPEKELDLTGQVDARETQQDMGGPMGATDTISLEETVVAGPDFQEPMPADDEPIEAYDEPEEEEEEDIPMPPPSAGGISPLAIALIVLVLVFLGIGGFYAYNQFGTSGEEMIVAVDEPLTDDLGVLNLDITAVEGRLENNAQAGPIIVIQGEIANNYPQGREQIQLMGELYDKQGNLVAEEYAFAGAPLTIEEFRTLDQDTIIERFASDPGYVAQAGAKTPFTMVFFDLPDNAAQVLEDYTVEPVSSLAAVQ